MHSEVFVRFRDDLRIDRLLSGLPAGTTPALALSRTYFSTSPDVLSSVVYARAETRFVYIVFAEDERSVRVHVEGRASKGNLRELVRQSERLADRFVATGRSFGVQVDSAAITLYADDYLITVGMRAALGRKLLKRFAETIFGDVVVGSMTGVLTGLLTGQWDAALVVGLASVLCLAAWLTIEIAGGRDAYEYEGF
jgi:hypothetical protein